MASKNKGTEPKAPTASNTTTVTPKLVMKGHKVLQHHLFESSVEDCFKNVSYEPGKPDLKRLPHKHWFHTIDSRGKKLSISSILGNHFHDMTWGVDTEGNMFAKSGPPMWIKRENVGDGEIQTYPEQVHWKGGKGRNEKVYKDEHTHTWEYIQSEEFTAKGMEQIKAANQAEMAAQGVNLNQQVKPLQNAAPFTKDDPATISEG